MKFYYPHNLESQSMVGVWTRTNIFIIGFGFIAAVIFFSIFLLPLPILGMVVYAILTVTVDDISIYGYMRRMGRFVVTQQLIFYWRQPTEVIYK